VIRLAQAVAELPLRPVATDLASSFGRDGVGQLAAAIDLYQRRLVDADGKERQFFADASHELRTPIAVIQGAVEVLRDDPEISIDQGNKLSRIDRSITELGSLLEALLLSARGLPAGTEALDLEELCQQTLERMAAAQPEVRQRIGITGQGPKDIQAPRRWVSCILDVLFRRILASSPEAIWQVSLSETGLDLHQPLDMQVGVDRIRRSDIGIGIVFIERLAGGMGWSLEQRLSPSNGLSISLHVPPNR
jgi:signal transduction histidine kinase